MDTVSYIREDMQWSHELLELVMADVTQEQLDWHPPGMANPLGATYSHAVCSEDAIVQQLLLGKRPLFADQWQGKTGISQPQWGADFEWARELKVELSPVREYAQAVYAASDDYLASLTDADLDRTVDLTQQGFGERNVAWVLSSLIISHTNNMAGESSVLKGLQGAKGYPW